MARPGVEEVVRILASISADKIMLEILQAGYSSSKIRNEFAKIRVADPDPDGSVSVRVRV